MKRVACLYRVSTKKQVDQIKDDIPMQRIACREFAERQQWYIVMEKEEKGISGFKVSAEKRDAIQELKESALKDEFDILLVFMFDRLGRIDNETPFILEWFISHGIEIWSVNEGQQKIESHTDKLMNYIRFWQASGESEKTAIRVRTRLSQMVSDGIFTGGVVPFGYTLVDRGRKNKKGNPAKDLVIDERESEMVKKLFSMVADEGYGSYQLSTFLNNAGFRTRKGCKFQCNNVLRILKNRIYTGYLVRGETVSEHNPDWQIIDEKVFERVQVIIEQRNNKNAEKRTVSLLNKSRELLSGNVYCSHCGSRLVASRRVDKYTRLDGTIVRKDFGIYVCYHRSRKLNDCDGATTYYSDKVDKMVLEMVRYIFTNVSGCPEEESIREAYKSAVKENIAEQKYLSVQIDKDEKQLEFLRLEIGKTLTGDSMYSPEDLRIAIDTVKSRLEEFKKKLEVLKSEEADKKHLSDSIIPAYRQFKTWSEEFESCSFEAKKMIVNQLFDRIEIGKGYKINFVLNLTYKQFCNEWMELSNTHIAV